MSTAKPKTRIHLLSDSVIISGPRQKTNWVIAKLRDKIKVIRYQLRNVSSVKLSDSNCTFLDFNSVNRR